MVAARRREQAAGVPLKNSTSRAPSPPWQGEESSQALKRSRAYVANIPARVVLEHVDQLRTFDRQHESRQMLAYLAGAIGVICAIGGVMALSQEKEAPGVSLLLIGIGVAIPAFVLAVNFGALNFDNRRYELLGGLLRLLRADMAENAPVSVQLDLSPHTSKEKLQRTGKVGYWDASFFVDRWFDLQSRLVDGTKYSITLIEKNQHRTRTKRSASGKLKTKTKKKSSSEAVVRLKVKAERYPRLGDNMKTAAGAVQLPKWATVKKLDFDRQTLTLRVAMASNWDVSRERGGQGTRDGVQLVAAMLLSLYQVLNRSQEATTA